MQPRGQPFQDGRHVAAKTIPIPEDHTPAPSALKRWMLSEEPLVPRHASLGGGPSLVSGHLADGRRLFFHSRISAGYRAAGGRRAFSDRHRGSGGGNARLRSSYLCAGRGPLLCGTGLHRDARKSAAGMVGQVHGAGAAGVRDHGLRHHHDAVCFRRRRARHAESVSASAAGRCRICA